jgi:AcrR family transcriptional regulator
LSKELRARPLPQTDRGRETRQKLLDAAESIFGGMGFHEASVTQIVAAAGVGQGTFYLYFGQKRDIFIALVDHLAHSLRRSLNRATAGLATREEVERAGFRAFFAFVARHPMLYRIVRQAEFVDEEAFRAYYRTLARGYRRGLEGAMAAGEFRSLDAEALGYALMGIADFVGMRYVLWQDPGTVPADVTEDLMRFILDGLRSRPDGRGSS